MNLERGLNVVNTLIDILWKKRNLCALSAAK